MATSRSTTTRRKATRSRTAVKSTGKVALDRLDASLDAAQKAVADLRGELRRTGKDLFGDVQKLITDARRDTRRMSKSALKDLDQLQETVRRGRPAKAAGRGRGKTGVRGRSAARKRTSTKGTARKRTTTKRAATKR